MGDERTRTRLGCPYAAGPKQLEAPGGAGAARRSPERPPGLLRSTRGLLVPTAPFTGRERQGRI